MSIWYKEKPKNLIECLESLKRQTRRADEIVLIEDGLIPQNLKNIIDSYLKILNIKRYSLKKNLGLDKALNYGLNKCAYDLVARMDTDDICSDDRFEKQVEYMASNNVKISATYYAFFDDSTGHIISDHKPKKIYTNTCQDIKLINPIAHSSVMFSKSAILSLGGYPSFRNSQDYALWANCLVNKLKIHIIPEMLIRIRGSSISRRNFRYFLNELKILRYHKKIGFINSFQFLRNAIIRFFGRLLPIRIKILALKMFKP